jgi:hypothetical protein
MGKFERKPLQKGTVIKGKQDCEISALAGEGGSSLVYQAKIVEQPKKRDNKRIVPVLCL